MGTQLGRFRWVRSPRTPRRLVDATRESLYKGIEAMIAGNRIGDIGHAVQHHVEAQGVLGGALLRGPRRWKKTA